MTGDLQNSISEFPETNSNTILIGLGNEYRRDDGAGLIIVRKLKSILPPHIVTFEVKDKPTILMEIWNNFDRVIVFDAVYSGNKPGTIYQFNPVSKSLPTQFVHSSTHSMSLIEVIELSRALCQLPLSMMVYGIEGKSYEMGYGLSKEVTNAVEEIVEKVTRQFLDDSSCKSVSLTSSS